MAATDATTPQVRDLRRHEFPHAAALLSRGMRDNPLHVVAFGPDPVRRRRLLERQFTALFRIVPALAPFGAFEGPTLVGVTGAAPPGTCASTVTQQLRFAPTLLACGPRTAARIARWVRTWRSVDPDEPHSHFGPFAVDTLEQGRGIGTQILAEYTGRLDAAGVVGYLETDKPENVRLYARHGFVVTREQEVIGVPNWFMRREPRPAAPSPSAT